MLAHTRSRIYSPGGYLLRFPEYVRHATRRHLTHRIAIDMGDAIQGQCERPALAALEVQAARPSRIAEAVVRPSPALVSIPGSGCDSFRV